MNTTSRPVFVPQRTPDHYAPPPEWERRRKHDREIEDLVCEHCKRDKNGIITFWDGPKMLPAMHAKGHTSLDYHECACSREPLSAHVGPSQ